LIVAVGECGGRRAIATAFLSVTLPAFEFLKKFLAVLDAVQGQGRFWRNTDGITGFLGLPSGEKVLMKAIRSARFCEVKVIHEGMLLLLSPRTKEL